MKKIITNILLIASLVIILDTFSFWNIALEFFFAGIIPGLTYRINPSLMIMLFSVVAGLIIGAVFVLPTIKKYDVSKTKHKTLKTSNKLA